MRADWSDVLFSSEVFSEGKILVGTGDDNDRNLCNGDVDEVGVDLVGFYKGVGLGLFAGRLQFGEFLGHSEQFLCVLVRLFEPAWF